MSQKEEEFPFDQFVEALAQTKDLRKAFKNILGAIVEKNIYWAYSAISTLIQIIKSKDEEPYMKCRSMEAMTILFQTCEYPVVIFIELYVVPVLLEIANYRGKKSDEAIGFYFQQKQRCKDNELTRKYSLQFVLRGVELLFFASKIKPYRTVQTQQLKEKSIFGKTVESIVNKTVVQPTQMKYCKQEKQKQYRKLFKDKLKKIGGESQEWTEFLLVNLLEEVQTGKKELLELRLLIGFGQSFLSSAVINFCEEELMDISQSIDLKRKYLALLNQLVRYGDIEAIIMVKNSQFVPTIFSYISKFPGHQGLQVGQNIYPEVKASKNLKKQFYCDFLRCLQTWATCMPEDYDSDDFNIKTIYQYLKKEKKFKFPENMLLNRYQKEIKENLIRNQERNEKLLEILENAESSRQPSTVSKVVSKSKISNVLQKTTLLAPAQLELKLQEIKKTLKQLTVSQQNADKAFKVLVAFKDNWITYLESLDIQTDEAQLEDIVTNGERLVQQIQLIVPLHANLEKGKFSFREYKNKVADTLQFHMDVSHTSINQKSALEKSKSVKISKLIQSKLGKSKLVYSKMGKSILQKIKAKSRIGEKTRLNMSKAMDRSNMLEKSRYLDKSKNNVMENSMKQTYKKTEQKKQQIQESQQSETQKYPIESKIKEVEQQSPHKSRPSIENIHDKPTSKKEPEKQKINLQDSDFQEEKVVRVADYEVEPQPSKRPSRILRGSSRQKSQSGSRILVRRNNSRLDRSNSSESRISIGRKSISSRKVKQTSLSKRNQIEHDKTKKISEVSAQNLSEAKQSPPSLKALPETLIKEKQVGKDSNGFDKFKSEAGQISSIYSDSNIRPNHQAERVVNQISQIEYSKQIIIAHEKKEELVQYVTKGFVAPLVGDYYEDNKSKPKVESPKKKMVDTSKTIEKSSDNAQFKNIFKNDEYLDKKQIRSIKRIEKPSNQGPKTEPMRQTRHTTKNIPEVKQFDGGQNKARNTVKDTEPYSSQKLLEAKVIQQQKNKQIMALQQKIKDLERQSVSMRKKLAAKDSELRSIKSGSNASSQKGFAQFTVTSGSNFDKTSLRSSSASRRVEMTQFQKEVESGFKQYLERLKGNTFKKSLLKMKCLVHRTDEIQIGCLSQRFQNTLDSTLYVTPHRYDMIDFSISVIHDHRLRVKVTPEAVKLIPALKQQKVHLTIEVLNIPFCLPEFEINYKADSQYCSSYSRLTLPIGFNKFCSIKPLDFSNKKERHIDYVKSDNFKLNTKVIKTQKIADSFSNFTVIPATKGRDCMLLGASCSFGDSIFNIVLNVGEKWCWWEGYLLKGQSKGMNFLICSLKQMIDGSKK